MTHLKGKALLAPFLLVAAIGLLLFAAAGTVAYWQGWLFLAVFIGALLFTAIDIAAHDPALLQRRRTGGPTAEHEGRQKTIMLFISIGFAALLVVPGLDHRFGWSSMPPALVILGDVLIVAGFGGQLLVFRENTFAAATVEIAKDQRVISTGPYALVRHPQYVAVFLYLLGMPLALGSYWGLLVMVPMTAAIIWRLFDEERLLSQRLPGYADYQRTVRWRLIPGIF
jgi:protein-S-isoprenylcysteine O-methyltransferase Ste14